MKETKPRRSLDLFEKLERNAVYPRVEQQSKQFFFFKDGLTKKITDSAILATAESTKED